MCEDDFDPAAGWRCDAADCSGVNDSFSAAIVLYGCHYSTTIQLLYIRVVASCSCTGNELRHSFVSDRIRLVTSHIVSVCTASGRSALRICLFEISPGLLFEF